MSQTNYIGLSKIISSVGSWKIKTIKLCDYLFGTFIAFCVFPRSKKNFPKDMKKLLIIRPGGIGDAIFLLPILRLIKNNDPHLTIDILCEKRNIEGFLSQKNCYTQLYCYDRFNDFKHVLQNDYDVVFDTEQWHYFSALVAFFIKTTYRIGFNTRRLRGKLFEEAIPYDTEAYELDNFNQLFARFLPNHPTKAENIDNSFTVSDDIQKWAIHKIPENTVSLFLGASIAIRRLTQEQSLLIIEQLIQQNLSIVLLGGKDIEKEAEAIENKVNNKSIYNFAGKLNLEESAALIQRSKFFIGTDSGLMHLACAVGIPVIGIFGPGNVKKWGPRGAKHKTESLHLSCSPCTIFGYTNSTCHGKYQCMREFPINIIVKNNN